MLLAASASIRLVSRNPAPFGIRLVRSGLGDHAFGGLSGGQVRLHRAAHHAGFRIGGQQVQRRRGGSVRIGIGAHYWPSVGRGARFFIGRWSRTLDQAWFYGHRPGPTAAGRRGVPVSGVPSLLDRLGYSRQAGQGGAVKDLTDVVQRDDQFLEPVQRGVVLPVQEGATVLL